MLHKLNNFIANNLYISVIITKKLTLTYFRIKIFVIYILSNMTGYDIISINTLVSTT